MFAPFSLPFSLFSRSPAGESKPVMLPPCKVRNIESESDKTSKRMHSLIKLNHTNHSVIYHNLQFHNHTPHILGSAYILGATAEHLNKVYEVESESLEPWKDSPGEISYYEWREYLGKRDYQRAYVDFFGDQLTKFGYDWKKLIEHFVLEGEEPMINALISGLGHPLIHLAYAYELNSRTVAVEALTLGACFYSDLHKYMDDPSYTKPSTYTSSSVLEILQKIADDSRFDNMLDHPGGDNIEPMLEKREDVVLEHWNAWDVNVSNLQERFKEAQHAAAALVAASQHRSSEPTGWEKKYDFFLLHGLTSSHAVRILLPNLPGKFQLPLVRQWLLFVLLAYVGQLRPKIDVSAITGFKPKIGEDTWKYVHYVALNGDHSTDAHFVKGLRTMEVAEETWGKDNGYWLQAACKMASEFDGWGGFDDRTVGYKAK